MRLWKMRSAVNEYHFSMASKYSDDYYSMHVLDFEGESAKERYWHSIVNWAMALGPFFFMAGSCAGITSWSGILAVIAVFWIVLQLFAFLHEINENIRYVRHQLRLQRDGLAMVAKEAYQYRNRENFDAFEFVTRMDDNWLNPQRSSH